MVGVSLDGWFSWNIPMGIASQSHQKWITVVTRGTPTKETDTSCKTVSMEKPPTEEVRNKKHSELKTQLENAKSSIVEEPVGGSWLFWSSGWGWGIDN